MFIFAAEELADFAKMLHTQVKEAEARWRPLFLGSFDIRTAIRAALLGLPPLDEKEARRSWRGVRSKAKRALATEIVTLRDNGCTLAEISERVCRAPSTVREIAGNRGVKISRGRKVKCAIELDAGLVPAYRRAAERFGLTIAELLEVWTSNTLDPHSDLSVIKAALPPPAPTPMRVRTERRWLPAASPALARSKSPAKG